MKRLAKKLGTEITVDEWDLQVKQWKTWGVKQLFEAKLSLTLVGESFVGEGSNEEDAKCSAFDKALVSLDMDSREMSKTVPLIPKVTPHVIGKKGNMKEMLEGAFPSIITIKANAEATIVGKANNVECVVSLLELASTYFGEESNPVQLPAKLDPYLLRFRLPSGSQGIVFDSMNEIGKKVGALILNPRSQISNEEFELWILSSEIEARLAAKLDVIGCVVHKIQRLDGKPGSLAHFAADFKEKLSKGQGITIDVKHYLPANSPQQDSFISYAIGSAGRLAELWARATKRQSVKYFQDPDAVVPEGKSKVIACVLGDRLARECALMCITWLLDTWKSGHYADITDAKLHGPDFATRYIPKEKADRLKHRLKDMQYETASMCFFQSVPERERKRRESLTLVIFSRDANSKRAAQRWVDSFLSSFEADRVRSESQSVNNQIAGDANSRVPVCDTPLFSPCACSVSSTIPSNHGSVASQASAPPKTTLARCYVSRTSFCKPDGGRIAAAELKSGDIVLGPSGNEVRVLRSVRLQPNQERDFICFTTENMPYPFQITADHRLPISRSRSEEASPLLAAGLLQPHAEFYLFDGTGERRKVVQPVRKTETEEVVEVTFEEDEPVLAWVLPKNRSGKSPGLPCKTLRLYLALGLACRWAIDGHPCPRLL